MADAPPVAVHGTPNPSVHPGIKGFMTNNTAGMPNWVWLLVIAGGVGLAIAVKHFTASKATTSPTTTGTDSTSGIGLAVDPTTGLPYAVEGLVPSGGTTGTGGTGQTGPTGPEGPPGPTGTPPKTPADPPDRIDDKHQEQFNFGWIGTLKQGTTFSLGGYDPSTGLQRFWYTEPGGTTKLEWLPAGASIVKGGDGRLWLNPAGLAKGKQGIQITGTKPDWPGGTTQPRMVS